MSYRDLRNFTEMLRALGYPNLVSLESFRRPNFPLVADILVWLTKRFDNDTDIALQIDAESDRVALIRNVAQFMAIKANIKLNTKRLYQADGYAVKELLKMTTLLYDALKYNQNNGINEENMARQETEDDEEDEHVHLKEFDVSDKVPELQQSRQLASEITSTGATLYDLLGKEIDLRTARQRSVGRQYEANEVEAGLRKAIESIGREMAETRQQIDNVSATEANLDAKIERRKIEIDRYDKRLQTLKKVRPAFLEEFTVLEHELEKLFVQYSVRVRCLNQLEQLAADAERARIEQQQQQRQQLAVQKIVETVRLENFESTDGAVVVDDDTDQRHELSPKKTATRQERPRARTGGRTRNDRRTSFYGGTEAPIASTGGSVSSLDLSTDSESEEIFLPKTDRVVDDRDDAGRSDEDDDSLGLELSAIDRAAAPSGRKTSQRTNNNENSDDDF